MYSFKSSGKLKAVTFSLDDGVTQDIRMIQLLNKYGLKATFNINSDRLNQKGMLYGPYGKLAHYKVWREDVKEIYQGHEVAAHTLTHPNLTTLTEAEIIHQVEDDRKALSELVGYEVVGMAYPCGGVNNDDRVAQIIKSHTGIKYARTITTTEGTEPQDNLYRFDPSFHILDLDPLMTLGRDFIDAKPEIPQILYIWGHSYEMDLDSEHWIRLENFFKLISGKEDIFYGTNQEVLL